MRPVERGAWPVDTHNQPKKFTQYQDARHDLIERLGEYCSYCEMHLDASLAVEHVQPKSLYPSLSLDWNNFLLACTNCNSKKGDQEVDLNDYVWPHRDNTYRAFSYTEGGVVKSIIGVAQAEADRMIKLVGLDATPNKENASDRRWLNRREAWDIAQRAKDRLTKMTTRTTDQQMIDTLRNQIVDTAKFNGYWSIWIAQFQNDSVMLKLLITSFPGTCQSCFDANNHYVPIPRSGGVC